MTTDQIGVQIIFRAETPHGTYQDALYLTMEEYGKTSPEEIDQMKQTRIDSWIAAVSVPAPKLSDVDKIASIQTEIDGLTERIQDLETAKTAIVAKAKG